MFDHSSIAEGEMELYKLTFRPVSTKLSERIYESELFEDARMKSKRLSGFGIADGYKIIRILESIDGYDIVRWQIRTDDNRVIAEYGPFSCNGIMENIEFLNENGENYFRRRFYPDVGDKGNKALKFKTRGDDLALALAIENKIKVDELESLLPFNARTPRSMIRAEKLPKLYTKGIEGEAYYKDVLKLNLDEEAIDDWDIEKAKRRVGTRKPNPKHRSTRIRPTVRI